MYPVQQALVGHERFGETVVNIPLFAFPSPSCCEQVRPPPRLVLFVFFRDKRKRALESKGSPAGHAGTVSISQTVYFILQLNPHAPLARARAPPLVCVAQVLSRHEGAKTLLDVMDKGLADEASCFFFLRGVWRRCEKRNLLLFLIFDYLKNLCQHQNLVQCLLCVMYASYKLSVRRLQEGLV